MQAELQQEHQWLQQLVGEWQYEHDCSPGPDQPAMKCAGTEVVRSVGGLWMVCEGRGEMPGGGTAITIMTLGYDPEKKKFLGTFIGSMMTHMWVYEGVLEPGGKVLTLNTEGPSFSVPDKMAKYQDIIEIKNANQRELRSQFLGDDGKWCSFMKADYHRK